jgi:type IV pilus assembly protein PilE
MITVAIVAILARIAMPSYLDYVKRGKLTEAFNALSGYSLTMGQYYQDNRTWTSACASGAAPLPASSANFSYSCPVKTSTAYTVKATGVTGSPVAGFEFTLDQAGVRATTAAPTGWTTSTSCWISSRSGACQ